MLNAVKAYLAYRSDYLEDFVESFSRHGLGEENQAKGTDLSTIAVYRQKQGVFPLFGKALEPDFDAIWPYGKNEAISLKSLLYNLAYIHRAYIVTYTEPKKAKIPEMFIPLPASKVPYYYKGNDSNLYMKIELDKNYFPTSAKTIPSHTMAGICSEFTVSCEDNFILQSVRGAKRNSSDSLSKEFKELNCKFRKEFQYKKSNNR